MNSAVNPPATVDDVVVQMKDGSLRYAFSCFGLWFLYPNAYPTRNPTKDLEVDTVVMADFGDVIGWERI